MSKKTVNENSQHRRQPRSAPCNAVSAATMGKALVILASSCAALSGHSTMVAHSYKSSHSTALNYRISSDEQPVNLRYANQEALSSVVAKTSSATKKSPSTPSTHLSRVRIPVISAPSSDFGNEQLVMDEYLEYVEKRYSRMHRREDSSKTSEFPGVKLLFSVMALPTTLRAQGSTTFSTPFAVFPFSTMSSDDPLNTLGLSNLASARLRQKLLLPLGLRDEYSLLAHASDTAASILQSSRQLVVRRHVSSETAPVSIGGRHESFVNINFAGQFRLMVNAIERLRSSLLKTFCVLKNFASRLVPEILRRGGTVRSVRMLSVASVALVVMVKPLFKGFFRAAESKRKHF